MKTGLPGLAVLLVTGSLQALEVSGHAAAELQWYPQQARDPQQLDTDLSLSFQPKLRQGWNDGNDELGMELFIRLDEQDDERQHADIRELKWLHVAGDHEWRVGVDTVFWGVTESRHLVDVINQIDSLEGFDGEDKLGQPMIHYTFIQDLGALDLFVLTGFRERSFHSPQGRLRPPLPVDDSQTIYQSNDAQRHIDYALRYTHIFDDVELGLSWFDGTQREPVLLPGLRPVLIPYYAQMTQFGLDLQAIVDAWTWKLEAIRRLLDDGSYSAASAGFEYSFYGIWGSTFDLGTLLEYSWESRDQNAGVFDNDLFVALRLVFNDVQSTDILGGILVDTDNGSQSIRLEASRRLGDSWKINAELQVFSSVDSEDPLSALARDDYALVELALYF